MTCRMAIRGIGLVGGFGSGTEAALNALHDSAVPNDVLSIQTSTGEINYPVYQADPGPLKDFVPSGKLRRTKKYSRLAALAACLEVPGFAMSSPITRAIACSSLLNAILRLFEFLVIG